jgi:hypothetical protein
MSRPPEVTETEIIDAGIALEERGRLPNPGAIRGELGNKGSYTRINKIWENYVQSREACDIPDESDTEIDLPADILENLENNIKQAIKNTKNITISSFKAAQKIAEKRIFSTIEEYKFKVAYFEESEIQAGIVIDNCDLEICKKDEEIDLLKQKIEELIEMNGKLLGKNEMLEEQIKNITT